MHSSMEEGPRNFTITPSDHGGILVVVSTLLMTWSVLCLAIRYHNRVALSSALGVDDFVCGVATACGAVQTLVGCIAVSHGFGRDPDVFSHVQVSQNEQYEYAIEILCVVVIGLTKATMLLFHLRITPRPRQRIICHIFIGLSAIWTIAATAVVGVRCGTGESYALSGKTCNGFVPSWIGLTAADCALEMIIFAVPIWILWDIQTTLSYKITIAICFASRLFVIAAAVVHASTAAKWASTGFDSVGAVTPTVWLQVEANYAIFSSTFPTLGILVKSLNTRWGAMDGPDVTSYALESLSHSQTGKKRKTLKQTRTDTTTDEPKLRPESTSYSFRVRPQGHERPVRRSDDSDQMIIRKTVSSRVDHQDSQRSEVSM